MLLNMRQDTEGPGKCVGQKNASIRRGNKQNFGHLTGWTDKIRDSKDKDPGDKEG